MTASRIVLQFTLSSLLALSLALACGGDGSDDGSMGGAGGESSGGSASGGASSGGRSGSGGRASGGTGAIGPEGGSAGENGLAGEGGGAGESSGGTGGTLEGSGGSGGTGGTEQAIPCGSDADCRDAGLVCASGRNVCVECLTTDDCEAGEVCQREACVAVEACETSLDCGSTDLVCVDTGRPSRSGVCLECGRDADCSTGDTCFEGECVAACDSDKDCTPHGLLCDQDNLTCVECFNSAGCDEGEYCSGGSCALQVCAPGTLICLGDDLGACNETGSGYEQVDSCFGGSCQMQGGTATCVD